MQLPTIVLKRLHTFDCQAPQTHSLLYDNNTYVDNNNIDNYSNNYNIMNSVTFHTLVTFAQIWSVPG